MTDCVALKFELTKGCLYIKDIDLIRNVSSKIKEEAKKVVKSEINEKLEKYKLNPFCFCLLPLGMVIFIAGGVLASVIFPYNFFLVALGFGTFIFFGCFTVFKSLQWPKYFANAIKKMDKKTNGEIRLEPVYVQRLVYRRKGLRMSRNCSHFLVKTRNSKMNAQRFLAGELTQKPYAPVNPPNPLNPLNLLNQTQPNSINMQPIMSPPVNMIPMQNAPHRPRAQPHVHGQAYAPPPPQFNYPANANTFVQRMPQPHMAPQQAHPYTQYNVMPNPQMTQNSITNSNLASQNMGNVPPLANNQNFIAKQNNINRIPAQPYQPHPNFNNQANYPPQNFPQRIPFQNSNQPNIPQKMYPGHRVIHGNIRKSPFTGNNIGGHPQNNLKMMNNVNNVVSPNEANTDNFYTPNPRNITNLNSKK